MVLICANFSKKTVNLKQNETILVTGATGLVGNQIVQEVLAQGGRVIGLARNPPEQKDSRVQWESCDLLDIGRLEQLLVDVDKIYHCAGLVSFDPAKRRELYKINTEGTANLVNAAITNKVTKLLHLSSVAAIGEPKGKENLVKEEDEWNEEGSSDYGKSKHLAEMEVWRGSSEGLPVIIINPSIILGSGDWNNGSSALFKTVYEQFPWYTEGVHGFVDVKDVARVAVSLMESDIIAERFIINGHNLSYEHLFKQIALDFGKRPPYKKVTKTMSEFVWRAKYIMGLITGNPSILNKNTARTALSIIKYDSDKLKSAFPEFAYTDISETISRVCKELIAKYELK